MPPSHLTNLSFAAVFLWLGVTIYFVRRFVNHRKVVSLAIAAMALGWAANSAQALYPESFMGAWFSVASLVLGVFVIVAIVRVETTGR